MCYKPVLLSDNLTLLQLLDSYRLMEVKLSTMKVKLSTMKD